jgi:nucleotide-binding universal stress UspA family protein
MFKHILFPTDNSKMATKAFAHAVNLARTYDGKITLLNIHEEFLNEHEREVLRVSVDDYKDRMRERAVKSREKMTELVEKEDATDISEIILREGYPRKEIVSTAEEVGADVIVMASNGRSTLSEALIGSTAEHVVRSSPLPVFVIKIPD